MDERLILSHMELLISELEMNYIMTNEAKCILSSMQMLTRMGRRDRQDEALTSLKSVFFDGAGDQTNRIIQPRERRVTGGY